MSPFGRRGLGDEIWEELEEALLGAPTAFGLLERLRARVAKEGAREPERALAALRSEIADMLRLGGEVDGPDRLLHAGEGEWPMVVLVVGVNGVGKTTTMAKLANMSRRRGSGVVLGAADT